MAPSHVLVPLDGSPLADEALGHALEIFDCRITVLNVVTPLGETMSEGGVREADDARLAEARSRAEELVDRARDRTGSSGQPVETVVETGEPGETILAFVDTADVDHVVMGGHGGPRNPTLRRLLGTVATAVVGEAPVPVTVVR